MSIFTRRPAEGPLEVLCEDCGPIISDWSRDSKRILIDFISPEKLLTISLLKLDSHDRVHILRHSKYNLMQARFSPDERSIAFVARMDSGHSRIMVAPYQNETRSPESSWIALTDGGSWDTAPQWSPDGKLVYFTSGRDGFRCIWAQRVDASRKPAGDPIAVYHFHTARRSPGLVPFNGMDMFGRTERNFSQPGRLERHHLDGKSAGIVSVPDAARNRPLELLRFAFGYQADSALSGHGAHRQRFVENFRLLLLVPLV